MGIPEISNISDFEAGMKFLESPSFLSRFFSFSGIEEVPQVYSIWKWGAVILVLFATFSRIIKKVKLLIIHIRKINPSTESILQHFDVDLDLSEDDDDESSRNSSDNEEGEPTTAFRYQIPVDEDIRVKGSSYYSKEQLRNGNSRLRRRSRGERGGEGFTWADFTAGKNVVKLWDSLGLSLGFDSFEDFSDSEGVVSLWDLNKEQKISHIFSGVRGLPSVTVAAPSQAVVLSAKMNYMSSGVVLGAYDTRMGGPAPAASAEWGSQPVVPAKALALKSRGIEKIYVRDDANRISTVGDMRKMKTPVKTVTETDGVMWCDAEDVIVEDEFVDCSR